MRGIHTSDWHLGQELHGFDRGVEHDVFLDWLSGQVIEQDADALVATGDVYDGSGALDSMNLAMAVSVLEQL